MSDTCAGTAKPDWLTSESLIQDLRDLGVAPGRVLLVHASMRSIGWVRGGAPTVVAALRQILGDDGTLVVPTGTADNSDTSRLYLARTAGMTPDEISRFRVALPAFDPVSTPSAGMGWIAECVRLMPGTIRSAHPQTSFAALGPQAHALMAGHAPDCHFGENSPLARLYQAGGAILLLGVGYQACSAFHLAEYRYVPDPPHRTYRCVISDNGQARWWEYRDVVLHDRDFAELGAEFDQTGRAVTGRVGGADCRLASLPAAVDFAAEWLRKHRARG